MVPSSLDEEDEDDEEEDDPDDDPPSAAPSVPPSAASSPESISSSAMWLDASRREIDASFRLVFLLAVPRLIESSLLPARTVPADRSRRSGLDDLGSPPSAAAAAAASLLRPDDFPPSDSAFAALLRCFRDSDRRDACRFALVSFGS